MQFRLIVNSKCHQLSYYALILPSLISFGNPRNNICDVCEKYVTDINAAKQSGDQQSASNLQAEHEQQKRKCMI